MGINIYQRDGGGSTSREEIMRCLYADHTFSLANIIFSRYI